jgi:putative ABC transport system substrate-binding protein
MGRRGHESLSRPSGNVTGVNNYLSDLGAKQLELLRELVPNAAVIGMLVNPDFPDAESQVKDAKEAARMFGQQVHVVNASNEGDFDRAFVTFVEQRAGALLVNIDPVFTSRRDQLVALAARHKIPAMYFERQFVLAGGLMSYSPNLADGYRQAGIYVARILKGAKPGDLPVVQPTKFDLFLSRPSRPLEPRNQPRFRPARRRPLRKYFVLVSCHLVAALSSAI